MRKNAEHNSPGGSVTALLGIYDTMRYLRCDVATTCLGWAASAAAVILAAGTPGKRYALPHATVLLHQPHGGAQGQSVDIDIQAREYGLVDEILTGRRAAPGLDPDHRKDRIDMAISASGSW